MSKKVIIPDVVGLPVDSVSAALANIYKAYMDLKASELELKKIEANKEIIITGIKERYQTYRDLFKSVFEERRLVIDKHFEIIDRGIKENNNELIGLGLQNLSQVVTSSPMGNAIAMMERLENGGKIEL